MALLPILSAPHPVLSAKARKVRPDEFGADLLRLLDDMAETMYAAPGVGLAAPQIGDRRRIVVADPGFEGEEGARRKGVDLVYMVNPEIIEASATKIKWEESCLSVPDLAQNVERSDKIVIRFQGADGAEHERTYEGFSAVVMQHELDHLQGVTLLEHSSLLKRTRYLQKQKKKAGAR
jgi:peptide deformylase